jgi:copper transporter 1
MSSVASTAASSMMSMTMSMAMPTGSSTSMSMSMDMSGTSSVSPSSTSAMDMSSMGSMGGMADPDACKINMLWNWDTVGACFISRSWHITSPGMFAGSCIGIILLTMSLEFLRRLRRTYDAMIIRDFQRRYEQLPASAAAGTAPTEQYGTSDKVGLAYSEQQHQHQQASGHSSIKETSPVRGVAGLVSGAKGGQATAASPGKTVNFRPKIWQQVIRALLHTMQFAVAYFVMLMAMYYNGYIIICILIGAFLGYFIMEFKLSAAYVLLLLFTPAKLWC